jgi:hypothetical protein
LQTAEASSAAAAGVTTMENASAAVPTVRTPPTPLYRTPFSNGRSVVSRGVVFFELLLIVFFVLFVGFFFTPFLSVSVDVELYLLRSLFS